MGSWCPNCLDESLYLKDQFEKYHEQGLEVVGLTFERARNYETALKRAKKMERDLKLPYPILLAGATRKDNAAELLPMLNHIMSYPTSIYLNKNHKVVKIHTGFAGPGTPLYEDFLAENDKFIQALIN
jgi:thiol-disulfide isomerase/thioredoxin